MLLCEQPENLFDRLEESKNNEVNTKFKYLLCPIQEKGRRIPIHLHDKKQLDLSLHWTQNQSIHNYLKAKPSNRQLFKNKYQMPNIDELLNGVSQIETTNAEVKFNSTVIDLNYAYRQF